MKKGLNSLLLIAVFIFLLLNHVESQLENDDKSFESCSSPTDFQCKKSGKCIKKAYVCNDIKDCGNTDNSDEEDCGKLCIK